jgi:hypothetical protein
MSLDQFRAALSAACQEAGGNSAWATRHGVTPSYVSQTLAMHRTPGPKLLDAMRWRKVVTYEPVAAGERIGRK